MRSAWVLAAILGTTGPALADPMPAGREVWISVGNDAVPTVQGVAQQYGISANTYDITGDFTVMKLDEDYLDELSDQMHEKHARCGGFMVHDSFEEAKHLAATENVIEYTLDRPDVVKAVLPALETKRIETMIRELSAMKNRYYQSESGARASMWIADKWRSMTDRKDVTIELVDHGYPQRSIIMTIPGTTRANEVVVIGGHMDSIAPGGTSSNAPGADDDASGTATLTEVARVLLAKDFRPERTIKFMAYAAEEVGLRGSLSIVRDFKKEKVNVVGALQLDMTNYMGSKKDIWLISDYTSAAQNAFLISLIETYTKATWGWDKCGYACSDHASWHRAGVPASMPFEARFNEMNKSIHTNKDTLDRSGQNAEHAIKFARLAAAYAIELGKGDIHSKSTDESNDDSDNTWKWLAALASLGLAFSLWFRTTRFV